VFSKFDRVLNNQLIREQLILISPHCTPSLQLHVSAVRVMMERSSSVSSSAPRGNISQEWVVDGKSSEIQARKGTQQKKVTIDNSI
jgi:hypothetical protein